VAAGLEDVYFATLSRERAATAASPVAIAA